MESQGGPEDTICAVATPSGEGGIGIVRISGPDAILFAERIVRMRGRRSLGSILSHTVHLVDILPPSSVVQDPTPHVTALERIDEALLVVMRAPRSFTGEDVVEIQAHGGGLVLAKIYESCLRSGCRAARPGEFTKRAFLNGRMDLSQAEAVLDTIKATSTQGLAAAQQHLQGSLRREVTRLRSQLLTLLAHLEAGIDFVEEDIEFVDRTEMLRVLSETMRIVRAALESSQTGRILREGARVVIVGRPNVGKSSLLNRLLGESRSIVTNIPGTTRDAIEESCRINGRTISLTDTAGLRETNDQVEQEGIARTMHAMSQADLLILVVDGADPAVHDPSTFGMNQMQKTALVVVNKVDLLSPIEIQGICEKVGRLTSSTPLPISTMTGAGLDSLRTAIISQLGLSQLEPSPTMLITNVRHQHALERCFDYLSRASESIESAAYPECVAVDLRGAADELGEITGAITTDEILNQIFSEFCIGK